MSTGGLSAAGAAEYNLSDSMPQIMRATSISVTSFSSVAPRQELAQLIIFAVATIFSAWSSIAA
jgi:hypothetical protein